MTNKVSTFSEPMTIYIGNMSYKRDENAILGLFKEYGYIQSINLITDSKTSKSKGIAFVKMKKSHEALKAIKELNGKIVDGRTLKVSEALSRFEEDEHFSKKNKDEDTDLEKAKPKRRDSKKKTGLDVLFKFLNK